MNAVNVSESNEFNQMFETCTERISANTLSIAEKTELWTLTLSLTPDSPFPSLFDIQKYFGLDNENIITFHHFRKDNYTQTIAKLSPQKSSFFNCLGTSIDDCPVNFRMNEFFEIFLYTYDIDKPMTCHFGEDLSDMPSKLVFVGAEKHVYVYSIDYHQLFSLSDVSLDILLYNGSNDHGKPKLDPYVLKSQTCFSRIMKCPKKLLRPDMFEVLNAHTANESIMLSNG